jgi:hypothetical protein
MPVKSIVKGCITMETKGEKVFWEGSQRPLLYCRKKDCNTELVIPKHFTLDYE